MIILDSKKHLIRKLDETGRKRFEAFLDRNFPSWREHLVREEPTFVRKWTIGIEGGIRTAICRGEYVEIYDEFDSAEKPVLDVDGNVSDNDLAFMPVHMGNRLCSIDGDATPLGPWKWKD